MEQPIKLIEIEKDTQNLYRLCFGQSNKSFVQLFPVEGKLPLSKVDEFTSRFESSEELTKFMLQNNRLSNPRNAKYFVLANSKPVNIVFKEDYTRLASVSNLLLLRIANPEFLIKLANYFDYRRLNYEMLDMPNKKTEEFDRVENNPVKVRKHNLDSEILKDLAPKFGNLVATNAGFAEKINQSNLLTKITNDFSGYIYKLIKDETLTENNIVEFVMDNLAGNKQLLPALKRELANYLRDSYLQAELFTRICKRINILMAKNIRNYRDNRDLYFFIKKYDEYVKNKENVLVHNDDNQIKLSGF